METANWLILRDRGFTPAEQDAFLHWLVADPHHGESLVRHQQTWKKLDLLAEWRPEHSSEPNPDLLAKPRNVRWTGWAAAIVGLAAAVALVIGWGPKWQPNPPATNNPQPTIVVASMQESRVLEDGTVVQMNRGAMIGITYLPQERHVQLLKGEAQFLVAKNPQRPFFVKAGGVQVRAVGPAFNVRLDAAQVEVVVTEGKVQVNPPPAGTAADSSSLLVGAGEETVVGLGIDAPAPKVGQASLLKIHLLRNWQPELIDFDSTPLSEVVKDFNSANDLQLQIADSEL
ncbi:MAG: FecR domain-containing protein, partial [Opitutaceae bacterium]